MYILFLYCTYKNAYDLIVRDVLYSTVIGYDINIVN